MRCHGVVLHRDQGGLENARTVYRVSGFGLMSMLETYTNRDYHDLPKGGGKYPYYTNQDYQKEETQRENAHLRIDVRTHFILI